MHTPTGMFALYRLRAGAYQGWRIRDVWRHDPDALLAASHDLTTPGFDAAAIGLYLVLLGGLTHRPAHERHIAGEF